MRTRVLLATGLGLLLLATAGAPAAAVDTSTTDEHLVVLGGPTKTALEIMDVDRMAPGSSASQHFRLHLIGDVLSGQPALVVENLRSFERGCGHPEAAAGDVSCGSGDDQGELADELLVGIAWEPAKGSCDKAAAGDATTTLAALAGTTMADDAGAAAGDDTCLTVTFSLPISADNLVQSDAVSFDLRIGLLDAAHTGDLASLSGGGATGVLLPSAGHGGSPPSAGPLALPFTGRPLVPYAMLAGALILAGLASLSAARRRLAKQADERRRPITHVGGPAVVRRGASGSRCLPSSSGSA